MIRLTVQGHAEANRATHYAGDDGRPICGSRVMLDGTPAAVPVSCGRCRQVAESWGMLHPPTWKPCSSCKADPCMCDFDEGW